MTKRNDGEQLPVTSVFFSPESPTGYAVRFCYPAPERERVWVLGDWMFSDAARSTVTDSARIWPHEWKKGVFPHTLMGLKSTPKELKKQVPGEEIDVSKFEFDWDILKLGLYENGEGCGVQRFILARGSMTTRILRFQSPWRRNLPPTALPAVSVTRRADTSGRSGESCWRTS